ncbi:MAG TPA: heavy metal translocating P-type ATPase, partial [Pyrinomonadaceae bacterium]
MASIKTDIHEPETPSHPSHHTHEQASEHVELPITGMTCAACARRIERKLSKSQGVTRAGVNFATSRATVEYDPQATNVSRLIEAVKEVGYDTAGTTRADFIVDDSARPSGSSQQLEKYLNSLGGVVNASFNLGTMEVRVEYLAGTIEVRQIRKAIEDYGYRVRDVSGSGEAAEDSERAARAAEYKELRRKFWFATALSLPVLVIAMSHGRISFLNFSGVNYLQLALTTPVIFYSGRQFYRGAWAAFRHRAADMNTLIAVGTGAAYLYSVLVTFFPKFFATETSGTAIVGMGGMTNVSMTPVYFEAASVIIALILLGRLLESRAKGRTGEAIRHLIGLQPKTARVIRNEIEIELPIAEV